MPTRHRSDPGSGAGQPRYPGSFLLAFRQAMSQLGWTINSWLGDAVECQDSQGREQVVGLENLYRRARRAQRVDWAELIVDFLQTSQQGPLDDPPEDLAAVADRLLLRLGPPLKTYGQSQSLELWQQPIEGTGLVVSLVVDFPKTMFYVTKELVEESGKDGEEWLAQALVNLNNQTQPESFKIIHDESGMRQCCVGDAYDSSRALLLDVLMAESRQHGHLVAVPGRDELLVLPVTRASLPFIPLLKIVAAKSHRNAPYPISEEVFWIKDGQWHLFAIQLLDNGANVRPPEEFLPVLQELLPDVTPEVKEED